MPKHSKNNCALPVFTYAERQKLQWGNQSVRLGGDSHKAFDACSICLQDAVEPYVCTHGHLFCKGCIYNSLLQQKEFIQQQTKLYEEDQRQKSAEKDDSEREAAARKLAQFDQQESSCLPGRAKSPPSVSAAAAAGAPAPAGYQRVETGSGGTTLVVDRELVRTTAKPSSQITKEEFQTQAKFLPSYWLPSLTPDAKPVIAAPVQTTSCPAANHALRLKQLVPVKFKLTANGGEARAAAAGVVAKTSHTGSTKSRPPRFQCSSCTNSLSNVVQSHVLPACGHVVCHTCYDTFIVKDGTCVDCGHKVRVKDVIALQQGKSGFAGGGAVTVTARLTPAFQCG